MKLLNSKFLGTLAALLFFVACSGHSSSNPSLPPPGTVAGLAVGTATLTTIPGGAWQNYVTVTNLDIYQQLLAAEGICNAPSSPQPCSLFIGPVDGTKVYLKIKTSKRGRYSIYNGYSLQGDFQIQLYNNQGFRQGRISARGPSLAVNNNTGFSITSTGTSVLSPLEVSAGYLDFNAATMNVVLSFNNQAFAQGVVQRRSQWW